ncbi:hypothetical protein Psi01_42230 [Planobispora siamensis]|uniref:Uncharacterized protein n=1 Tax=Planobispora siamensis TaxID=936338 RepID=A0A8J3SG18_9ACTN|nr:hypothetical protein Psi01_42230 [Planobispora siamensis]
MKIDGGPGEVGSDSEDPPDSRRISAATALPAAASQAITATGPAFGRCPVEASASVGPGGRECGTGGNGAYAGGSGGAGREGCGGCEGWGECEGWGGGGGG